MNKILFILSALIFALTGCDNSDDLSLQALNQKCAEGKIAGEYLVQLESGEVKKIFASSSADLIRKIENQNLEVSSLDFNFEHSVQMQRPNPISNETNTDLIGRYGQEMIEASSLWKENILGQNIKIAVIDTGLDIENPFFSENLFLNETEFGNDEDNNGLKNDVTGWDFINNAPLTRDLQGHGTEVTSLISSKHEPNFQIGLAPEAKILPIAALAPNADGTDAAAGSDVLIKAVQYANQRKVDLINASWGGDGCSRILRDVIKTANDEGILFITSSGNDGENIDVNLEFPSSFRLPGVISVGGIDAAGQRVPTSNFGSRVNFFAPGADILAISSGNGFRLSLVTGTSIAAPFITGALALLKSASPKPSAIELKNALELSRNESLVPRLTEALFHLESAKQNPSALLDKNF